MAAIAMVFLMSTTPAAATETESCAACDNCYPGLPCFMCASYVMHALGNCCGAVGGWASCVNNEWGFYASCNGGSRSCQCSDTGGDCNPMLEMAD